MAELDWTSHVSKSCHVCACPTVLEDGFFKNAFLWSCKWNVDKTGCIMLRHASNLCLCSTCKNSSGMIVALRLEQQPLAAVDAFALHPFLWWLEHNCFLCLGVGQYLHLVLLALLFPWGPGFWLPGVGWVGGEGGFSFPLSPLHVCSAVLPLGST
jgi:hypothetical protein